MDSRIKSKIINSEEGRKFIVNIVDFFVNESISITKDFMNRAPDDIQLIEKRLYKDYKFIRDSINISTSPKEIYNVLIRKAALYIDFTEDGNSPAWTFPEYFLGKFELYSWFKNDVEKYNIKEMIITLINKLFNSIYRSIFV